MTPKRIHLLLFLALLHFMEATTDRPMIFNEHCFGNVLETHNHYLPELKKWRQLIAQHANELARFLKTFPGSEPFSEDDIRTAFETQFACAESLRDKDVFKPWTNRWSGKWSNGTTQYHIWDKTRSWNGQWVQPVTQSETRFSDKNNLAEMILNHQVDLAINVYSCETGITGWVSKRQHGRFEIPCIGYLLDDTTILWVTQIQKPNHLFAKNTKWLFFLERTDSVSNASQYNIYGQSVVIENGKVFWNSAEKGKHFGTYYSDQGHRIYTWGLCNNGTKAKPSQSKLIAITGATLIDGTGQTPLKDAVILIEGARVKAVGRKGRVTIPKGARVIEARGKFIIPGLIDSHVHLAAMRRHERADLLLPIYLRYGVTTVRDLGSPLKPILLLQAAERSGKLVSPRIFTSGPILDGSSGGWPTDGSVTTASEAEEAVERLAAAHIDLIKIYDGLSPETARVIIRTAHENGLSVTGHIPTDMTAEEAVEAGLDGIEHIEILVRRAEAQLIDHSELEKLRRQHEGSNAGLRNSLDQLLALDVQSESAKRLRARLAARQVILDPVLVACEAVWAARLGAVPGRPDWLTEGAWELQRHTWDDMAREFAGLTASERAELRRDVTAALKRMKALVGACHRAGVVIIAGTDGPGWADPGSGLHRELELLVEAGLSPMAALLAATRHAAKALGKEKELGTIEPGKLADLVILDADPLQDIRHARRIHRVMKGGVLFDPASLPGQVKSAQP